MGWFLSKNVDGGWVVRMVGNSKDIEKIGKS